MTTIDVATFEHERSRLFGLAYRMTGSVADADDVVQETWLRAQRAADVDRPAAWLTTVATRLAIDRLRAASRRREQYVGPWLPEPLLTDADDPARRVEADETLTLSFLHVLDRLEPVERAVFLLREVFAADYAEVAEVVGRTPDTCRQIAHRARERVRSARPRFSVDPDRRQELLASFLAAVIGDHDEFVAMLADDVVLVSDGGPTRRAARRPVVGPERVGRFARNLMARLPADAAILLLEVNGDPAIAVTFSGELALVAVVEFDEARVRRIESVSAPHKLAPLAATLARSGAATSGVIAGPTTEPTAT